MVFTRPQARVALVRFLDNVLIGRDGLKKALLEYGIQDIFDLCTIDYDSIDTLTYQKSYTEPSFPISEADKHLLVAAISYVKVLHHSDIVSGSNDWMSTWTQDNFYMYRSSPQYSPPNLVWSNPVVSPIASTKFSTVTAPVSPLRPMLVLPSPTVSPLRTVTPELPRLAQSLAKFIAAPPPTMVPPTSSPPISIAKTTVAKSFAPIVAQSSPAVSLIVDFRNTLKLDTAAMPPPTLVTPSTLSLHPAPPRGAVPITPVSSLIVDKSFPPTDASKLVPAVVASPPICVTPFAPNFNPVRRLIATFVADSPSVPTSAETDHDVEEIVFEESEKSSSELFAPQPSLFALVEKPVHPDVPETEPSSLLWIAQEPDFGADPGSCHDLSALEGAPFDDDNPIEPDRKIDVLPAPALLPAVADSNVNFCLNRFRGESFGERNAFSTEAPTTKICSSVPHGNGESAHSFAAPIEPTTLPLPLSVEMAAPQLALTTTKPVLLAPLPGLQIAAPTLHAAPTVLNGVLPLQPSPPMVAPPMVTAPTLSAPMVTALLSPCNGSSPLLPLLIVLDPLQLIVALPSAFPPWLIAALHRPPRSVLSAPPWLVAALHGAPSAPSALPWSIAVLDAPTLVAPMLTEPTITVPTLAEPMVAAPRLAVLTLAEPSTQLQLIVASSALNAPSWLAATPPGLPSTPCAPPWLIAVLAALTLAAPTLEALLDATTMLVSPTLVAMIAAPMLAAPMLVALTLAAPTIATPTLSAPTIAVPTLVVRTLATLTLAAPVVPAATVFAPVAVVPTLAAPPLVPQSMALECQPWPPRLIVEFQFSTPPPSPFSTVEQPPPVEHPLLTSPPDGPSPDAPLLVAMAPLEPHPPSPDLLTTVPALAASKFDAPSFAAPTLTAPSLTAPLSPWMIVAPSTPNAPPMVAPPWLLAALLGPSPLAPSAPPWLLTALPGPLSPSSLPWLVAALDGPMPSVPSAPPWLIVAGSPPSTPSGLLRLIAVPSAPNARPWIVALSELASPTDALHWLVTQMHAMSVVAEPMFVAPLPPWLIVPPPFAPNAPPWIIGAPLPVPNTQLWMVAALMVAAPLVAPPMHTAPTPAAPTPPAPKHPALTLAAPTFEAPMSTLAKPTLAAPTLPVLTLSAPTLPAPTLTAPMLVATTRTAPTLAATTRAAPTLAATMLTATTIAARKFTATTIAARTLAAPTLTAQTFAVPTLTARTLVAPTLAAPPLSAPILAAQVVPAATAVAAPPLVPRLIAFEFRPSPTRLIVALQFMTALTADTSPTPPLPTAASLPAPPPLAPTVFCLLIAQRLLVAPIESRLIVLPASRAVAQYPHVELHLTTATAPILTGQPPVGQPPLEQLSSVEKPPVELPPAAPPPNAPTLVAKAPVEPPSNEVARAPTPELPVLTPPAEPLPLTLLEPSISSMLVLLLLQAQKLCFNAIDFINDFDAGSLAALPIKAPSYGSVLRLNSKYARILLCVWRMCIKKGESSLSTAEFSASHFRDFRHLLSWLSWLSYRYTFTDLERGANRVASFLRKFSVKFKLPGSFARSVIGME